MLTKLLDKLTLKQEAFLLMVIGAIVFFSTYGAANEFSSTLSNVPSYYWDWETKIPFVSWMIVPYMSSDILFVIVFFMCTSKMELRNTSKRMIFVTLFSVLCYLIYPLKCDFVRPDTSDSIFKILFDILSVDKPYNQNPSLHISYGMVIWFVVQDKTKGLLRTSLGIWFLLIGISTLTVYQHHFIDIIGGVIASILSVMFFPLKKKCSERRNVTMATNYYLVSIFFFMLAFPFDMKTAIFLYPSLTFFLVGNAYYYNNPYFIKKNNGKISIPSMLLYGPFLLAANMNWRYFRMNDQPWVEIKSNLIVGRRLNLEEARELKKKGDLIIFDLAPEHNECRLLTNEEYHYFPLLDICPPNKRSFDNLVKEIESKVNNAGDKIIYIHCALGYSRSILSVAAFLKSLENCPAASIEELRQLRPKLVLPEYLRATLEAE